MKDANGYARRAAALDKGVLLLALEQIAGLSGDTAAAQVRRGSVRPLTLLSRIRQIAERALYSGAQA